MTIIKWMMPLAAAISLSCCKKTTGNGAGNIPGTEIKDTSGNPPFQWQEHWGEHEQLLTRMYFDSNVVVYFDKDVNREVKWPFEFFSKVWGYTRKTYGEFGKNVAQDDRLYAIFHTDKYWGGHPAAYFDVSHDLRNVLDVGTGGGTGAWRYPEGWNIGAPVHEIGHIVEGGSNGVKESPAFDIWGDSKWAEIFVYDVYKTLGMQKEADAAKEETFNTSDTYPAYASQWFRDWFLPVYEQYGGAKTFDKYFKLLAAKFPQSPYRNLFVYNRRMNWGEYIHFMSGATGTNLQPMAAKAFGWPADWTVLLQNARQQFPTITYAGIADALVMPKADIDISASGVLTVSKENSGGASSSEGSGKLVDNDVDTKFYLSGFTPGFWATLELSKPEKVNSYSITTGNDDDSRDPKDFELLASNDNSTWTSLDTMTYQKFSTRKASYRFRFVNDMAYKYYRLKINAVKASAAIQLGEWKLWKTD